MCDGNCCRFEMSKWFCHCEHFFPLSNIECELIFTGTLLQPKKGERDERSKKINLCRKMFTIQLDFYSKVITNVIYCLIFSALLKHSWCFSFFWIIFICSIESNNREAYLHFYLSNVCAFILYHNQQQQKGKEHAIRFTFFFLVFA